MSNFKIEKCNAFSEHETKQMFLSKVPVVRFPNQITLLNYSVEHLRDVIQSFFQQVPIDRLSVVKVLKIVGCSLNDTKLIASIEKILAEVMDRNSKSVYDLLALWTTIHFPLTDFLVKVTANFRKALIAVIFEHFLLSAHQRERGVLMQLGTFLTFTDRKQLLNEMKKRYQKQGSPMKVSIRKCMSVKTQLQQLKEFILNWASFCISVKVERLMEFTLDQNRQELQYLIENVPSMSATFINQLKQTITTDNIGRLSSSNSKINTVLQSAIKQWLNDQNNYWKIVEQRFDSKFEQQGAAEVISYGKMLVKEHLQSECMTIKLLYNYFEGQYFNFEKGDVLVSGLEKDNWIQAYRCIGQSTSHRLLNLIILNKTLAPSWWKSTDPRKAGFSNKNLKKVVEKHSDFLEGVQKEYMAKNKRVELVFNVLIIVDKQTNKQSLVTFEQLSKYLEGETLSSSYKQWYSPYKVEIKQKQEVRKQHNIIIEAKLVRLLKRSKQSLTVERLAKESGYSIETVQLAIKRLLSKDLAEEDGKDVYKYSI